MSLTISIKINGRDVRATYGLEILSHDIHNLPDLEGDSFNPSARDGQIPGVQTYRNKQIKLNGYIDQNTHALLLTAVDNLKTALYGGAAGKGQFTIEFTDYTDRYFLGRMADLKIIPIGPVYTATKANVELMILLDSPFGIYDQYTITDLTPAAGFTFPNSIGFNHSGKAITRPKIFIQNIGNPITQFILTALAIKNQKRAITGTTSGTIARASGRWGDVLGAASFVAASTPGLYFASAGNFNPRWFSIVLFFNQNITGVGNTGYLFSTTGNVIKLYEKTSDRFTLDVNGTELSILHSASHFTHQTWFAIAAGYDSNVMAMMTLKLDDLFSAFSIGSGPVTPYVTTPTNFYVGSDATPANAANKKIDEFRIYNGLLPGIASADYAGSWLEHYLTAGYPLPINIGCPFRLSFDRDCVAEGCSNTTLTSAESIGSNLILEIDSETQSAKVLTVAANGTSDNVMDNISGEFPHIIPGANVWQFTGTGTTPGFALYLEDKRRFL
jgi:hypothetical protein